MSRERNPLGFPPDDGTPEILFDSRRGDTLERDVEGRVRVVRGDGARDE